MKDLETTENQKNTPVRSNWYSGIPTIEISKKITFNQFLEKVPLHLMGLLNLNKMATKASAKKAAPSAGKKPAAGASKAKPKGK